MIQLVSSSLELNGMCKKTTVDPNWPSDASDWDEEELKC